VTVDHGAGGPRPTPRSTGAGIRLLGRYGRLAQGVRHPVVSVARDDVMGVVAVVGVGRPPEMLVLPDHLGGAASDGAPRHLNRCPPRRRNRPGANADPGKQVTGRRAQEPDGEDSTGWLVRIDAPCERLRPVVDRQSEAAQRPAEIANDAHLEAPDGERGAHRSERERGRPWAPEDAGTLTVVPSTWTERRTASTPVSLILTTWGRPSMVATHPRGLTAVTTVGMDAARDISSTSDRHRGSSGGDRTAAGACSKDRVDSACDVNRLSRTATSNPNAATRGRTLTRGFPRSRWSPSRRRSPCRPPGGPSPRRPRRS